MQRIKILILDQDISYSKALGAYLSFESQDFEIQVVDSDGDALANRSFEDFQIALIDENLIDAIDMRLFKVKVFILLSEDPYSGKQVCKENKINQIFKYLSAAEMAREIRFIYALVSESGKLIRRDKKTRVIGFISGASCSGNSVITVSIAREMSRRYSKAVLYLCISSIDSTGVYFKEAQNPAMTMADFLYYIFRDATKKSIIPPESFMFRDSEDVYAFYPSTGINELNTLNASEMESFLQYIFENGDFDYIVIDFNQESNAANHYLLKQCQEIFVIYGKGLAARFKSEGFIKYFDFLTQSLELNNYKKVYNFSSLIKRDYLAEQSESFNIEEDYDSFCENDQVLDISMNNTFGSGIRRIGEYILKNEIR